MDSLIEEVKKIDNEIYRIAYRNQRSTFAYRDAIGIQEIWNRIKGNNNILEIATRVVRDKFDSRDTFLAPTIVECMLIDGSIEKVDPNQLSLFDDYEVYNNLYQSLINNIYSNTDLARKVLDGYSNGGYSFLLYTLFDDNLDLTEEQKAFAIEEAMHKIGTRKYEKTMQDYKEEMNKKGITDKLTVIAPEIGPIGAETFNMYFAGMLCSLNENQAHGSHEYDIRYHILKNHNFADKMEKLVYDFYADDEDYDRIVDYWEWDIVNLCRSEDDYNEEPALYVDEVLFISEEEVFERLPHERAVRVIEEIRFIKKLHEIREPKYRHLCEYEDEPMKKVIYK